MKKLILGLTMAFAVGTAWADVIKTYNLGGGLTAELDSDGLLTISGSGAMPNWNSSFNQAWKSERGQIKSVIAEGVTSVGGYAFFSCSALTNAVLPLATTVGSSAFENCYALTTVSLSEATSVGTRAFYGCKNLLEISLPKATTVGEQAFYECSALTEISLPLVTTVGEDAFDDCSALTNALLPLATTVGERAFYGCKNLLEISLPNATSVGGYAFDGCSALTSVSLPNATSVGKWTFWSCSVLTNAVLPLATTVGERAFYSCKKLTSISLPNATSVGGYAFSSCSALTTVSLPLATSVGENVFSYCYALTEISLPNATSVGVYAFYECSSLTNALLPLATTVEERAFYGCKNLLEISLPKATSVGYSAFYGCSALTEISLPLATTVGEDAFYSCSALTTVTVKDAAMKQALEGNRSYYGLGAGVTIVNAALVKSYDLGDGLTAELDSDGLLLISGTGAMPEWVSDMDQVWKDERGKIKSVIAEGVTSVGPNAFYGCSALTTVSLPNATTVGEDAFEGCSALTTVIVKDAEMKQTLESNRSDYGLGKGVRIISVPTLTKEETEQATWGGALMSGDVSISAAEYEDACIYFGLTPKSEPQVITPPVPPEGALTTWDAFTNAVAKATNGTVIAVGADISEANGVLTVAKGKTLSIRLYGKTLSCKGAVIRGALTVGAEDDPLGKIVTTDIVRLGSVGTLTLLGGPVRGTFAATTPGLAVVFK